MEKIKKGNNKLADTVTIGFALFAMFFGAGNLIFPPYLGRELGDHWFLGFLCYIGVDIGLGLIAMMVIAVAGRGSDSITEKLGVKLSAIFLGVICICIGPAIAIPRVASITYEVGLVPNFGNLNPILCTGVFFVFCWLICISKSEVMDIVGKILSPLMVIALLYMIVKGIITPIGDITMESSVDQAVSLGVSAGYQTMDMMAAVIFSISVIFTIKDKNYTAKKDQFTMLVAGGLIATALLFVVYGGLAYIGATYAHNGEAMAQADVLVKVVLVLLGKSGLLLLGLIVILACLTTAIGLITSISEFFEEKLHISYKILVTVFTIVSFLISNLGTDIIINMAAPILGIVYPVLITLTFCSIAGDKLPVLGYRGGAAFAFIIAIIQQIEAFAGKDIISHVLPMNSMGFGWIVPAIIGVVLGAIVAKVRGKDIEIARACEIE